MKSLTNAARLGAALCLCAATHEVRADQVELQNGERLAGKVLTLNANSLVVESETLGKVTLPRERVAVITLKPRTPPSAARLSASTNLLTQTDRPALAKPDTADTSPLGQVDGTTNSVKQIQSQLLSDMGPEANLQFSQMVAGLISGRLTVGDLRTQAKAVADQARALKRDGTDDPTGMLDSYLAILDNFLRDSAPAAEPSANAAAR